MIASLLVANRGEIACRVMRTAGTLGIRTIAVYSDADGHALHVRTADEAVAIGGAAARDSYLAGDRIIAAARATGAEAIHPGYGFLSENADFAQAVLDAGLIWVGATPASIRAMGLKDAAKARMIAAGVPVTPGYFGDDQTPERLRAEADAIGYPVLIKAVAGGGGKGMRRVDDGDAFAAALAGCRREAASSFGDDRMLLEKYVLRPRHIEVQVFGDSHGQVVHLFERDCSLQRRHQKVIEEAPAPGMDVGTREAVCAAAVRAARAVDYVGAGTIEFIADAREGLRADRIWFMEMNTRLQVEHPVTEAITGQDLVEWQLRVACGEPLPLRQDQLAIDGWAVEARLYAEDPAAGFLPSVGRLDVLTLDRCATRIETGVEQGDAVSPFYDPMIAKLVAHAATREAAIDALAGDLDTLAVWPVRTNAAFLGRLLADATFRAGEATTAHIGEALDRLVAEPGPSPATWTRAARSLGRAFDAALAADPTGPWYALDGFRLNAPRSAPVAVRSGEAIRVVDWCEGEDRGGDGQMLGDVFVAADGGQTHGFTLARGSGRVGGGAHDGAIVAPMPGRVIALHVAADEAVVAGQTLLTLEAMKMEQALTAPFDGRVADLAVREGVQVVEGMILLRVMPGG